MLQSHDIDVIVGPEALSLVENRYGSVTASTHIGGKKWRAEIERIHLDLYVPYQSRLGSRLKLRVEALPPHAERVDRWLLLALPAHLVTKFAALLDRPDSEPGEKDRMEIWRLLQQEIVPDDVWHGSCARLRPRVCRSLPRFATSSLFWRISSWTVASANACGG